MDLAALYAAVEALRARPGSHLAFLHTADDPSESDPGLVHEIQGDLDAIGQSLIEHFTGSWGEPQTLHPYGDLAFHLDQAYGWCVDGGWIALGVSPHTVDRAGAVIAATGAVVSPA
jgi:hypothetical protein